MARQDQYCQKASRLAGAAVCLCFLAVPLTAAILPPLRALITHWNDESVCTIPWIPLISKQTSDTNKYFYRTPAVPQLTDRE